MPDTMSHHPPSSLLGSTADAGSSAFVVVDVLKLSAVAIVETEMDRYGTLAERRCDGLCTCARDAADEAGNPDES